ncbi:MAG TPA: hypothetical protein VHA12_03070 [Candidatus Nanoarchaeia archaeon]|nr:hypothetical protein [Candidatus Nanoarchaeia archaeon]
MTYRPEVRDYEFGEGLPRRQPEVSIFQGASEETPYLLVQAPINPGRRDVAVPVRNQTGTIGQPWDWRAAELAGLSIED